MKAVAEKRPSAREQVRRDDEIVKARMRGVSWPAIAARFGLSERRCQQVMAEYRASHPTARHRDPLELLDEILEGYEAAREDLAEIVATTTHPAARVGAIRSSLEVLAAQTNLLISLGVIPPVEHVAQEIDAHKTARTLIAVLHEHDASDEMMQAIARALDGGRSRALMSANGTEEG